MTDDRAYPTDPRGTEDAGDHVAAKPCCAALVSAFGISWCSQPDSHNGSCSGPPARLIEGDDLGPASSKRRRY